MSYSYPEIRQLKGLYLQRNSFEVPDGALEQGENIVISRDFVHTKRRGFYTYFTPGSGSLAQLFRYQDRLIGIYSTKLGYYTDTGTEPNEVGTETLLTLDADVASWGVTSPRVCRAAEANNNLYLTTDAGTRKLTAYNSRVSSVGGPPGMDLTVCYTHGVSQSFLLGGKIVAYRVVFGRLDANSNLILGAPGDIATIGNVLRNTASVGSSVTYTSAGAGPWTVTVTSADHGLYTGDYIVVSDAADENADGTYQVTVTSSSQFTYSVTSGNPGAGPSDLSWALAESVICEFSVPAQCASTAEGWFFQLYRSDSQDIDVGVLSDYKLLTERKLTSAEISAKRVIVVDSADEILLGAELYTNENTREGESQANARPPKADDIALYKGYMVYAGCTIRANLDLGIVDSGSLSSGDTVTIRVDGADRTYKARTGVGNIATYATFAGAGPYTATCTAHGLVVGDTILVSTIYGGTFAAQTTTVATVPTADTLTFTLTGTGTPTGGYLQAVTNLAGDRLFRLSSSASPATALAETAQGLIKAINRDSQSLVYGRYLSSFSDVPGQIRLLAKEFPTLISAAASSAAAGAAFSPVLPTSFASGDQVESRSVSLPNAIYISKGNEPEAVPLVNTFEVAARNKNILRVAALRDSLLIIKSDGVYRMTGDNPGNFTVTALDATVVMVAANSLGVINNEAIFLTDGGLVSCSETAVNVISRQIEEVIQPIVGQDDLATRTALVTYESERLVLLSTTLPNDTATSVVYCYNTITQEWTTWDKLFIAGCVGPKDTLYLISTGNVILRERKSQTKVDYCDQNYSCTVTSVAGDGLSAVIALSGVEPEAGDILVLDGSLNRIKTAPTLVSAGSYSVTFVSVSGLEATDTPIFYKAIRSRVKFSPFHAGLVGRSKQFAQVQLHFRSDACSRLILYFSGDTVAGSETVEWRTLVVSAGWGLFPWGFEPWGQPNQTSIAIGTRPAGICRIYVPRQQQRNTFIQLYYEHQDAGEPINLQAVSWSVRPYKERVSR